MSKPQALPRKAWGYARVSSEDQVRGESLDVQRSKIRSICEAEDLSLEDIFVEEGVSGSKPLSGRPEGANLLQRAKRGDTIVALRLDRMFRNTSDALDTVAILNTRGVRLYLADMRGLIAGDAAGELHFSMLASFATFERRRIGERIREAKRSLRARGVYGGGDVPFGYRKVDGMGMEEGRRGGKVQYIEPDPDITSIGRDLLAKGYSSRLAAGHFKQLGYSVTHHAVNRFFNCLRSGSLM